VAAIPAAVLRELVCPACRGDLARWPEGSSLADGSAEALLCHADRLRYPVVDGAPWLVPEKAQRIAQRGDDRPTKR